MSTTDGNIQMVKFSLLSLKRTPVEREQVVRAFTLHGIGDLVPESPEPVTAMGFAIDAEGKALRQIGGAAIARFPLPRDAGKGWEIYAGPKRHGDDANRLLTVFVEPETEIIRFEGIAAAAVSAAILTHYSWHRKALDVGRLGVAIERAFNRARIFQFEKGAMLFIGPNEDVQMFAHDSRNPSSMRTLGQSLSEQTGGRVGIRRHSFEGSPDDVAQLVDAIRRDYSEQIAEIEAELQISATDGKQRRASTWERRKNLLGKLRKEMLDFEGKLGVSMQDLKDSALTAERSCASAALALMAQDDQLPPGMV